MDNKVDNYLPSSYLIQLTIYLTLQNKAKFKLFLFLLLYIKKYSEYNSSFANKNIELTFIFLLASQCALCALK